MTELIVTIDNEADPSIIRQVLKSIKGILSVRENTQPKSQEIKDLEHKLASMRRKVDPALIDLEDERTQYLMSK